MTRLKLSSINSDPRDEPEVTTAPPVRFSRAELIARGEQMRKACLRRGHAVRKASSSWPDPVQLVEEGDRRRK